MPQLSTHAPRGLASLFLGRNLSTHSCPTPPKVSPLRKPKNPYSSRQSSGLCPRPHPQRTQEPSVCRLVVALHIWRGKKYRAKERVDSISERHRRGNTTNNTLSCRFTHTLTETYRHRHTCSHTALLATQIAWTGQREAEMRGRWKEGPVS